MRIDETAVAPVNIRVPADKSQVAMVRAIAETLAVLADFSLDEVADIKLAVDEAAMTIIGHAGPGAELTVAFTTSEHHFNGVVQSWLPSSNSLPQTGFGWHVLQTLTESVTVHEGEADNDGGRLVAIELVK
ncbi:ATP-binding protein [Williamsia muralis]|uniref:ATP-binding protein n=1 Tax=Williamsia marianensis TaxID=85044 RepID=UPI003F17DB28